MAIQLYSSPMKYKDPTTGNYVNIIGVAGNPGKGIASVVLNNDYTLTINFTDNTSTTTASIRGESGITPAFSIGTVVEGATAAATITGSAAAPVLNLTLPTGNIPTKVSQLQNDSGFLTEHQSLSNYVQKTDYLDNNVPGLIMTKTSITDTGFQLQRTDSGNYLRLYTAPTPIMKAGTWEHIPVVNSNQHEAAFYGLAKAAGDSTQSSSSNAVGTYTANAKAAIQTMLGVPSTADTVLDTTLSRGRKTGTTVGVASIAFGVDAEASGYYSVAFGLDTAAVSQGAFAEGKNTVAHYIAHAEGENTQALGQWAHSEGVDTIAKGAASHAGGDNTIANGHSSFVTGKYNVADSYDNWDTWTANTSYVVGDKVKRQQLVNNEPTIVGYICKEANTDETFTISHWDFDSNHMNYPVIVGNGYEYEDSTTHEDVRVGSNAYALDWDGNGYYKGDVYVGANADSSGGSKLAKLTDIPVTDVQLNGTSILSSGVANIPIANASDYGVVKVNSSRGIFLHNSGQLSLNYATSNAIKKPTGNLEVLVPYFQHESVFYGLSKVAGVDLADETVTLGTYPDTSKAAIQHMLGVDTNLADYESDTTADQAYAIGELFMLNGKLHQATAAIAIGDTLAVGTNCAVVNAADVFAHDVKVADVSVVTDGVANIPFATYNDPGVAKINSELGITITNNQYSQGFLCINAASEAQVKTGTLAWKPLTPERQHLSTFYGLAKAAGDTSQASSSNAVGTYTDSAKASIKAMLGIQDGSTSTVDVSGTTPTIVAVENTRYVCGEVSTLSITPPVSGICIVRFTSGTTATVVTVPNTVKFPEWFDVTALDTNTIYEMCITDGVYGAVMSWAL